MTDRKHEGMQNSPDGIERVLRRGGCRAQPDATAKQSTYAAARNQWHSLVERDRRKRRLWFSALAATFLLAAALGLSTNTLTPSAPQAVDAILARVSGDSIFVNKQRLAAGSESSKDFRLQAGDTIATNSNSRIAIEWQGSGSLRVDNSSHVEILDGTTVRLIDGRIYYDSRSAIQDDNELAKLKVVTGIGTVSHVGTQFTAEYSAAGLSIGVREGSVRIVSGPHDFSVDAGNAVDLTSDSNISRRELAASGPAWTWATDIAPAIVVDGMRTLDLINWVAREMGLAVRYDDMAARSFAAGDKIIGLGKLTPAEALAILPQVTRLRYTVVENTLVFAHYN